MSLVELKREANYGVYVWERPNGTIFVDTDGNALNIPGRPHDIVAMNKLTQAAKHYGVDGKPKFLAGTQRVSEMRHSEEVGRMKEGYIPSETDIGAWEDSMAAYLKAQEEGWDYDRD